jgi:hypothetical protein
LTVTWTAPISALLKLISIGAGHEPR